LLVIEAGAVALNVAVVAPAATVTDAGTVSKVTPPELAALNEAVVDT
jgi:hypothetical protein